MQIKEAFHKDRTKVADAKVAAKQKQQKSKADRIERERSLMKHRAAEEEAARTETERELLLQVHEEASIAREEAEITRQLQDAAEEAQRLNEELEDQEGGNQTGLEGLVQDVPTPEWIQTATSFASQLQSSVNASGIADLSAISDQVDGWGKFASGYLR